MTIDAPRSLRKSVTYKFPDLLIKTRPKNISCGALFCPICGGRILTLLHFVRLYKIFLCHVAEKVKDSE